MITIKKQLILSALVLSIVGTGVLGVVHASAQSNVDTPYTSLVQKIADKFNLNKTEVQALFDQEHTEMEEKMKEHMTARLDQLVKDGKLTEAQKKLIQNKQLELQSAREATREKMKNMTDEERKSAMEKERAALETWAKKNSIDLKYVMGHGMKGHHFIMKMK